MGKDILDINHWKDQIAGDLKQFSTKKYRPVGLHHLTADIDQFTQMSHLIDLSYLPFSKSFIQDPKGFSQTINLLKKRVLKQPKKAEDNQIQAVILYAIPLPKSLFTMDLKNMKQLYHKISQQKDDIDYMITRALEKYGYSAITELDEIKRLIGGTLNLPLIFKEANMGTLLKNCIPISPDYGARMILFPVLTNAPLKLERDLPVEIPQEKLKEINYTKHIKDYYHKFGLFKTIFDTLNAMVTMPELGALIPVCYGSDIDKAQEINLMVKDPLDYQK